MANTRTRTARSRTTTQEETMATTATQPVPTSVFSMVDIAVEDIKSLRGHRRSTNQKYPTLIDEFVSQTATGEAREIKNPDGSDLDEKQVKRMYNGIRNYLRYQEKNGTTFPVGVHSAAGRLFLVNSSEG